MNIDNEYSWFENPDFVEAQKKLLQNSNVLKKTLISNRPDPFAINNVFDSSKAISEQKLSVPNLTGEDQFKNFALENPIPKDIFGSETMKTATGEPASNFLGTQGVGQKGAIADFAMKGIQAISTGTQNEGEGVMNTLNLGMKGAQAGMAVGGPMGAAIGGGIGVIAGGVDAITDLNNNARNERRDNKKEKEQAHIKLEQEQRQKDGLDSLSKLTALRQQQERFTV